MLLLLLLWSTYLILSFDKFDNVGGVVGEGSGGAALDILLQQVVDVELLLGHGEDDIDGVLLDLQKRMTKIILL